MKTTFTIISLCLVTILSGCKTKELTPEQQAKVTELAIKIENKSYTFHANSAQPQSGRSINLNHNYYVKVTPDTIKAYLPYFGRSYVAPMDPTNIGIEFVSTKFDYFDTIKNGGLSEIKIAPTDLFNTQNSGIILYLRISPDGYATLSVSPTNRQAISYYGTVD